MSTRIRFSLTVGLRSWDEDLLRRIEVAVESLLRGDELVATASCAVDTSSLPKVSNGTKGRHAGSPGATASVAAEDNAALFKAVLLAECPSLARAIEERTVRCLYQSSGPMYTIGRVGTAVWIKFSQLALEGDLAGNIRAAGEEAQRMLEGRTQAARVQASLRSEPEIIDFTELQK